MVDESITSIQSNEEKINEIYEMKEEEYSLHSDVREQNIQNELDNDDCKIDEELEQRKEI